MKCGDKTKEQLINELREVCQRITELKTSETERKRGQVKSQHLIENERDTVDTLDDEGSVPVPKKIIQKWQNIVNIMAKIINVPAALIMKVDPPCIEVFRSSESSNNPYKAGDREHLAGLYCETVIKTRSKLLVPNALKDKRWNNNPDIKLGMISYLGFPLFWPDGEVFGTICVLDSKENRYSKTYENLMLQFKELVEAHLVLLCEKVGLKKIITERKRAEETLKKFQLMVQSAHDAIFYKDLQSRYIIANDKTLKVFGLPKEKLVGKNDLEIMSDKGEARKHIENDRVVFETAKARQYTRHMTGADGKEYWLEAIKVPQFDSDGNIIGLVGIARDITELTRLRRRLKTEQSFAGMVGRDVEMLELFDTIREVAEVNAPILLQGESGTGKELVASAIHNEGPRGQKLFVPVNCSALPEGLLESELFGHVRGAFTGAIRDKKGRFELADGGTIFLDEVGDLSPAIQIKLLRVLQEGTFERVGGEETLKVDVRVISATNKDLRKEVAARRFREDLFYRLCVIPINLPPLRQRRNDIPLLANHILKQAPEEADREEVTLSQEALEAMMNYEWPGNVRELQNAIQYALVKCRGNVLQLEHLPPIITTEPAQARRPTKKRRRRKLNVASVRRALQESNGNKVQAARMLDVSRATLYRFLAESNKPSQA